MGITLIQNQKTEGIITDRFRIIASERILASKDAYMLLKHDPKKRENTDSDETWFGKTTFSKPLCIMCEENHLF